MFLYLNFSYSQEKNTSQPDFSSFDIHHSVFCIRYSHYPKVFSTECRVGCAHQLWAFHLNLKPANPYLLYSLSLYPFAPSILLFLCASACLAEGLPKADASAPLCLVPQGGLRPSAMSLSWWAKRTLQFLS